MIHVAVREARAHRAQRQAGLVVDGERRVRAVANVVVDVDHAAVLEHRAYTLVLVPQLEERALDRWKRAHAVEPLVLVAADLHQRVEQRGVALVDRHGDGRARVLDVVEDLALHGAGAVLGDRQRADIDALVVDASAVERGTPTGRQPRRRTRLRSNGRSEKRHGHGHDHDHEQLASAATRGEASHRESGA